MCLNWTCISMKDSPMIVTLKTKWPFAITISMTTNTIWEVTFDKILDVKEAAYS